MAILSAQSYQYCIHSSLLFKLSKPASLAFTFLRVLGPGQHLTHLLVEGGDLAAQQSVLRRHGRGGLKKAQVQVAPAIKERHSRPTSPSPSSTTKLLLPPLAAAWLLATLEAEFLRLLPTEEEVVPFREDGPSESGVEEVFCWSW